LKLSLKKEAKRVKDFGDLVKLAQALQKDENMPKIK
jgi:hypothetical protein